MILSLTENTALCVAAAVELDTWTCNTGAAGPSVMPMSMLANAG